MVVLVHEVWMVMSFKAEEPVRVPERVSAPPASVSEPELLSKVPEFEYEPCTVRAAGAITDAPDCISTSATVASSLNVHVPPEPLKMIFPSGDEVAYMVSEVVESKTVL